MTKKYSKQIYLGYKPDGKQARKWIYGDTLTELKAAERKARADFDSIKNPSDISFKDYADKWLRIYKADKSPATIEMYRTKISLCKEIWNIPLRKLTRSDYQAVVSSCTDRPNTAKKLALTLSQIIRAAASDGIIQYPLWKFEKIKEIRTEKEYLSDSDMIRIFEQELPMKEKVFVRLVGTFGLRPQEALALSKESIQGNMLLIDKAVGYDGNRAYIKHTKNDKVRSLPIPDNVISLLSSYIAQISGIYLFANSDRDIMSKSQARAFCERICKEIGIHNLYILRHTVATKLYYRISPKLASYYLGHSEAVFLNTYSHLDRTKETSVNVFE